MWVNPHNQKSRGRASPEESWEGSLTTQGLCPSWCILASSSGWQQNGCRDYRGHLQRAPHPEENRDCLLLRSLIRRKKTFSTSLPNRLPLMHQAELGHLPMLKPDTAQGKNSHDWHHPAWNNLEDSTKASLVEKATTSRKGGNSHVLSKRRPWMFLNHSFFHSLIHAHPGMCCYPLQTGKKTEALPRAPHAYRAPKLPLFLLLDTVDSECSGKTEPVPRERICSVKYLVAAFLLKCYMLGWLQWRPLGLRTVRATVESIKKKKKRVLKQVGSPGE